MILVRMLLEAMSLQPTAMRLQPQVLKKRKKLNEPIGFKIIAFFPFQIKINLLINILTINVQSI